MRATGPTHHVITVKAVKYELRNGSLGQGPVNFLHRVCARTAISPRQYHTQTHTNCESKLRAYSDFLNENDRLPAYSNVCVKHHMNVAIK
jgi:hypothetical protein